MRMWLINPKHLCNKHLCGEHVEMHMAAACIDMDKNIQGYLDKGLLNPALIPQRHDELVREMIKRGMNHKSPINQWYARLISLGNINVKENEKELKRRCKNCFKER